MARENKKIRNATPHEYYGILFKSDLERRVYKCLVEEYGINPHYEGKTYTYWEGIKPTVPFYDRQKVRGKHVYKLHLNQNRLISMKYTPDFIFNYFGIEVIIEVKGIENDQFPLRKKLFRAYLETLDYPIVYAEIFTIIQLKEFMQELESKKEQLLYAKTNKTQAEE